MASPFKKNQFKTNNRRSQVLINSPVVKRMHNHPVAQQGWLMKRGSDGLMLWKKRWFVLSDYCLFYYKDTLEEKLLGSLVLASYVISPCSPDEKGYKKFSFKAEHTNMRTYYFAAENQTTMDQWIKSLTLASLLEENISCGGETSEQAKRYLHTRSQCPDYHISSQNDVIIKNSDSQPVYVNAPPKPKRLNESSSPECPSEIQFREDNFQNYQSQPFPVAQNSQQSSSSLQMMNRNNEKEGLVKYGRTNIMQTVSKHHDQNNRLQSQCTSSVKTSKENTQSSKNVSFSFPPRPHSVDFLEYASKSGLDVGDSECEDKNKIACRPKSSLSTVNISDELNHWSAEEYARKLRQSSMYIKPIVSRNIYPKKNETNSGNTSNSSQNFNSNWERQTLKSEIDIKNEKPHSAMYRLQNMNEVQERSFSRSASARLCRPMNDSKDEYEATTTECNSAANVSPDNYVSNKDSSKIQQREESMKRLLEWKQRMLQSPLAKSTHGNNNTVDCHSNYMSYNNNDSYISGSISSSGNGNEVVNERFIVQNELTKQSEKSFYQSPNQLCNDTENNLLAQSSQEIAFYNFSSSDHGLDGCGSKYEISLSITDNSSTQKDQRRNFIDKNNKLLNEANNNSYNSEPVIPLQNIRLPDTYECSEEKAFSNLDSDCNSVSKVELSTDNSSHFINNREEESQNKLAVTNSFHDFSSQLEKQQPSPIYIEENEKDEEWGIKLDESRVVKEFSYHYITSGKYEEGQAKNEIDSLVHGNYKNKIKPFNQDIIGSQSESHSSLRVSLLEEKTGFENHSFSELSPHIVEKLYTKSQRKLNKGNTSIKGYNIKNYQNENGKSFPKELGSKIYENTEKRLVQSDSEALLYDTSSDIDDKIIFDHNHLAKTESSSDDERDEEVAAALSKEKLFTNSVFESVKSPHQNSADTEHVKHNSETNDSYSVDIKVQKNNEHSPHFQFNHEPNPSTSTDINSDIQEENYMPMTPRKKSHSSYMNETIHSRNNSASHTLIIKNLLGSSEECPYVEMTQKGSTHSNINTNGTLHQDLPNVKGGCEYDNEPDTARYCEIGRAKDMKYKLMYNAPFPQEPLYMEVPSLKERDGVKHLVINNNKSVVDFNKRTDSKENINQMKVPSRSSLPDILNTTAPSLNQGSGRSDSSDADDEASKDLESLDALRHPRFSLSDTFRPASYYLGASLGDRTIITLNTEHPDSSDSDLVSPPPIPTCSPPLDDLEISIDSTIGNKDNSLSHLKSSNIYSNQMFQHPDIKELIPPYKIKHSIRSSNSNLYEASSEESLNYEKRDQRLKRRPLSADILSNLQDISFIMSSGDAELKINTIDIKPRSVYGEKQDSLESDHLMNLDKPKSKNNKSNIFPNNREGAISSETLDNDSESDNRFRDNRLNQEAPGYTANNITSPVQVNSKSRVRNQYENVHGDINNSNYKLFIEKFKYKSNAHSYREKSNFIKDNKLDTSHPTEHQNNAPYYYSDILKFDTKNFHDFDKNRWEEHLAIDNKRDFTILSNEKTTGTMINCNQSAESYLIKKNTALNEDCRNGNSSENFKYESNNASIKKNSQLQISDANYCRETHFKGMCAPVQESSELQAPQRTRSLEGLLDNTNSSSSKSIKRLVKSQSQSTDIHENLSVYSSDYPSKLDIWEEDTLWRESLRKVSIRHTRSLEDLDRKDGPQIELSTSPKMPEDMKTYENIGFAYQLDKESQHYVEDNYDFLGGNTPHSKYDTQYQTNNYQCCASNEVINNNENEIHQVNCDQRMSESLRAKEQTEGGNGSFEIDREKLRQWDLMSSAPAMLSSNRAVIKPIYERKAHYTSASMPGVEIKAADSPDLQKEFKKPEKHTKYIKPTMVVPHDQDQGNVWNLKVSAGELLGRTHEELVLLLIQLRRQRSTVCQSMEKCHREIETKAYMADLDKANRIEHLQKLDELKTKLADLEKQYEKGKPLVNLVDNMVKLGSLYQAGSPQKLEFIQRIQEQRLLAEERRDWERIRPDHHELKAKVERLYRLDRLLQEESGTLHSLQQDKGVLERAIGGLRTKLQGIHGNSPETEWYKRQQRLLERELSRVRSILALNSKKLEETVAENARLEQELVVLRQKLQLSRRSAEPGSTNTAALEAELCRVQLLVGNLLRQRQELSLQVRQLTEKSNSLRRQIWPHSPDHLAEGNTSGRKQLGNGWIETDLDADISSDSNNLSNSCYSIREQAVYSSPLYVNTANREVVGECCNYPDELFDESPLSTRSPECSRVPDCNEEDFFKQSYGLYLKEKPQEIKTVRIVKRESERRQRDRDRSGNIGIPISYASPKRPVSDDRLADKTKSVKDDDEPESKFYDPPPTPGPRTDSVNAVWNLVRKSKIKGKLVNKNAFDKCDSLVMQTDSPQLSPVYLSETARKIVEEVAWQGMGEKRLVPKEKRRHHTMSGPSLMAPQNIFSQMGSRDDLDIERVLRPRLTTPDVVRSTLIRVDPHYTKETIDNILGAPGKILIPERYIPESQPQLTKEEQNKRSKKADAIRKMLCETTSVPPKDSDPDALEKTSSLKRKVAEEKKNREHLLQLNQILAQQVMEKSKIVAGVSTTTPD